LATELAASRVKVLSPKELAARLATPFELLKDGRRPTRPQHETLRATMDWSHALLTNKEQVLFRRLSVFRGGWTLDAAEAVCAGDGFEENEVLDVLQRLVDKSLVDVRGRGGERRYRMLQTVRQYAGERLEASGEAGAVRRQHLDHFLALAEEAEPELHGSESAKWFVTLDDEYPNRRAALRWVRSRGGSDPALRLGAALGPYWRRRVNRTEGRRILSDLLSMEGVAEESLARATALHALAYLTLDQGRIEDARTMFEASLSVKRKIGDEPGRALSLTGLGVAAMNQGDYDSAQQCFVESLAIGRSQGDDRLVAKTLSNLGIMTLMSGDIATAQAIFS
jgi:tetratricopeptide (TPR) repeat protein